MNEEPADLPQVSVTLTGKMMQFNITVGFLLLALVAALWICSSSENPILRYGGSVMAILAIPAVVGFVIHYYSKQKVRPVDGEQSSVSISGKDGQTITVRNPPDELLHPRHIKALARCFIGYDRNICPDGEVLGKASEAEYRPYSEEEKRLFKIEHEAKISGNLTLAGELLANDDDSEISSEPARSGGRNQESDAGAAVTPPTT